MKLQHKNCGGEVIESTTIPSYSSEEYGIVPAYECTKCLHEILGDAQIEFIPENEADKIQIESIRDAGRYANWQSERA